MSYFHPRDFDKDQPIISELNYFRRFKSYFGLVNCLSKLEKWTTDFKFIDLRAADQQINWNEVPVIKI